MTPKDKAKELIDKFSNIHITNVRIRFRVAVEHSILAVEEVIESIRESADKDILHIHLIYWRKVKDELLKLKTP